MNRQIWPIIIISDTPHLQTRGFLKEMDYISIRGRIGQRHTGPPLRPSCFLFFPQCCPEKKNNSNDEGEHTHTINGHSNDKKWSFVSCIHFLLGGGKNDGKGHPTRNNTIQKSPLLIQLKKLSSDDFWCGFLFQVIMWLCMTIKKERTSNFPEFFLSLQRLLLWLHSTITMIGQLCQFEKG